MEELQKIAEYLGGYVEMDGDAIFIRVDTGDNTSKANYDDLLMDMNDIRSMLKEYEVKEIWADHDTQIINFVLKE